MVMILSLELWGGLSNGAHGTLVGLFPKLASRIVAELCKCVLVYITAIFVTVFALTVWHRIQKPIPPSGRMPDLEDISSSFNAEIPASGDPYSEENLLNDITCSPHLPIPSQAPENLTQTSVHFEGEGDSIPAPQATLVCEDCTETLTSTSPFPDNYIEEKEKQEGRTRDLEAYTPSGDQSREKNVLNDITCSPSVPIPSHAPDDLTQTLEQFKVDGDNIRAPQATLASEDCTETSTSTSPFPDDDNLMNMDIYLEGKGKQEGDNIPASQITLASGDVTRTPSSTLSHLDEDESMTSFPDTNESIRMAVDIEEKNKQEGHKYYNAAETSKSSWERPGPGHAFAKAVSHGPSTSSDGKTQRENEDHSGQRIPLRLFRPGKKTWWRSFLKLDSAIQVDGFPERFSYKQLKAITGNFSNEFKLWDEAFGSAYRGVLPSSGIAAAVMKYNTYSTDALEEFCTILSIAGQLRHRNIIRLLGWCEEKSRHLLVNELTPNGSLYDALFEEEYLLSWPQRFKILTDTAAALSYLHEGFEQIVVHRDVKCSNIMLDEEWNAKLGSFRIACLVDPQDSPGDMSPVCGTIGYICPEYISTGLGSDKTDVYAFGVVLFEVACGQRALSPNPDGARASLVGRVLDSYKDDNLLSMVDKRLGDYDRNLMEMVLSVGLLCTEFDPLLRPSMRTVVQMLAGDAQVPPLYPPSPPFSRPGTSPSRSVPADESTSVSVFPRAFIADVVEDYQSSVDNYDWVRSVPPNHGSIGTSAAPNSLLAKDAVTVVPNGPNGNSGVPLPERFSYKQLRAITGFFSKDFKLWDEGFGSAYRGVLPSSGIAVVVMNYNSDKLHAREEFWTILSITSRLKHENIIRLLGWCEEQKRYLLVQERTANGSLHDVLFRPLQVGMLCLSWPQRFKILTDIAAALCYLHRGSEQIVVHRYVNSGAIMLDEEWNAKLGKFELGCLVDPQSDGRVIGPLQGEIGYLCPEYITTYKVTDKTDVYAFGVLVFEVAFGQRPISPQEQGSIVVHERKSDKDGKLLSMVDKRLTHYDPHRMEMVLRIGFLCTQGNPQLRPSMRNVVQMLAEDVPVPPLPSSDYGGLTSDQVSLIPTKFSPERSVPPNYGSTGASAVPDLFAHDVVIVDGSTANSVVTLPERFSYEQLKVMTGNFSEWSKLWIRDIELIYRTEDERLARAYRGVLRSSRISVSVAVIKCHSDTAQEEFWTILYITSQISHRNISRLRGWCEDEKRCLLVYELTRNGSLYDGLFGPFQKGSTCLSWPQRFKILTDTATALSYLHYGLGQVVVHGDVGSRNIFLDQDWNAKLGNFHNACLPQSGRREMDTRTWDLDRRTRGYTCPDDRLTSKVTHKIDVFDFGAVLFEVACGQKAVSPNPLTRAQNLVLRVRESYKNDVNLLSMVDKRLGDYDRNLMERVLSVGLLCTEDDPLLRPTMRSVVKLLTGEAQVPPLYPGRPLSSHPWRIPSHLRDEVVRRAPQLRIPRGDLGMRLK
ncbi:unnamed protein product [Calypogeia fissa]